MELSVSVRAGELADEHDEVLADEAAHERLKQATYGICIDCDEEIAYERLSAYPTAKRCVRCQQQREHDYPRPGRPRL